MASVAESIQSLWLWGAVPLLVLAGLLLWLLLRAPTFTRLPEAVRTVRAPAAGSGAHPIVSVWLAGAASLGAAAAVAGATAVSLGGAGALAWLWLFGLVLAPLRVADVLLSRTNPPGRAGGTPPGSLVGRLDADASPAMRALAVVLLAALCVAASVGVLGVHGEAVRSVAEAALPGSGLGAGLGVAALAVVLVLVGHDKPWLGWVAGLAVLGLGLLGFVACLVDPSRALSALVRAIEDALNGASPASAFSGATSAEVAQAAFAYVLPPMVLTLGTDGALHANARGTTKSVASTALLSTLLHVVVATVVGVSLLATGAFSRRVDGERTLAEVHFVDAPFDSASQRLEPERAWTGYLRVVDGRAQAEPLEAASERGMIDETRFVGVDGEPANFAIRVRSGKAVLLLVPDDVGALQQADERLMQGVKVTGRMLPRGGELLAASMTRAGGDVVVRLALALLLVVMAVGAAAIGLALGRSLERRIGASAARGASLLPALALALAACLDGVRLDPSLSSLGVLAAAVVGLVVAVTMIAKAVEVSKL